MVKISHLLVGVTGVSALQVTSWYDSGKRLSSSAPAAASAADLSTMTTAQACVFMQSPALATVSVEDKIAFLTSQGVSASATAQSSCVAPAYPDNVQGREPTVSKIDELKTEGETVVAARAEMAAALAAKMPEKKAEAATPGAWPMLGGVNTWHAKSGPRPKDATRELWTPPPGWKPPTKPVISWYDSGKRLAGAEVELQSGMVSTKTAAAMPLEAARAPAGFEWGLTF